jgi:hypothetical protein
MNESLDDQVPFTPHRRRTAGQTRSSGTVAAVNHRRRALLRLALGQLQVAGATAALLLLLEGGPSPPALWAAGLTTLASLASILLFRLVWRPHPKHSQGPAGVQGVFRWPPKT